MCYEQEREREGEKEKITYSRKISINAQEMATETNAP